MKIIVLIPAAGTGRRMGAAVNKQYLCLGDRPVLAHTVALFDNAPQVDDIYIISPPDEIDYCHTAIVEQYGFTKVRAVVPGGAQRQDSVRNGLQACVAQDDDIVVIHDGARPFFPIAQLPLLIEQAHTTGACLVGIPVQDTIKEVIATQVVSTPERGHLWQAQTPQAFRYGLIHAAHERALTQGFITTDDAALIEWSGAPVSMMTGSKYNLKITTPDDLPLARAILAEHLAKRGQRE